MKLKRLIGLFILAIGLFLIISQINITGNAISNGTTKINNIFGVILILIGSILIIELDSLDDKVKTENSRIEEIRRFKPCKRVDIERVKEEIERVKGIAHDPNSPQKQTYHLHQVPVAGEVYLVADAKLLNRETNQSGRGNLRYLLDRKTNEYRGLGKEKDNGKYDQVA
jgi:hypothetical protein